MTYQRTEHIAAGQFRADRNSTDIYQAYLGTCLGVALYDKTHRIGGMIHILLPEPPGASPADYPEKYASSGIPLLIKQMTNLGASPEEMTAVIAGGALVGPVSSQDMGLDIGGRSADIATALLEKAGIEIITAETGGFFTCTLELDMATGETRITPPWEEAAKMGADVKRPRIEDIQETIDHLKPIPQTALKILRMFQNNQGIQEITQELSHDQVLTGQTLKLCNSALFAGTVHIDSLQDAVLLLGEEMLVKSVITAAVNGYYDQAGTSGYSLCKGGLYTHAVGVAAMAEKLADKTGRIPGKHAYTAGLLHDIGRVILDQYVADFIPLFFRNLKKHGENFINTEKKLLGITHCETGRLLAKNWHFSDALSQVISLHHEPEKATEHKDLVYIVYLADLLMERFNTGLDLEKMQMASLEPALQRLGLSLSDIPELVDTLPLNHMNGNHR